MKLFIVLALLLTSVFAYSQEICDNGIDDDGDGLIDLNDTTDCNCAILNPQFVPSLIPNPSFEEHSCCPSSGSMLNCADTWIQAGSASTDYYHTCDYIVSTPIPIPDGEAAVGMYFCDDWSEYVGACLISPLFAGTDYIIEFNLAFHTTSGGDHDECYQSTVFPPVKFTLFGTTDCNDLPFASATACPVGFGQWQEIGYVIVNPYDIEGNWGEFGISFNPDLDIEAIIIGPPCDFPSSGEYDISTICAPYFYIDNLVLNNSDLFDVAIHQHGDYCDGDFSLSITPDTVGTVQWYYDNIALIGETDTVIEISNNSYPYGFYQVVFSTGDNCVVAEILVDNESENIFEIPNMSACELYNLPEIIGVNLSGNQNYYSEPDGQGDTLTFPLTTSQTIYAYDSDGFCYSEESFELTILTTPNINPMLNDTVCDYFNLPQITGSNLSGSQHYYSQPNGVGSILSSSITSSQIVYIYDNNGACSDEEVFHVTIFNTPELDNISDQTSCLSFDLPEITGENLSGNQTYFSGPNGSGIELNSSLLSSQTVYFYDSNWACSDNSSFELTVFPEVFANAGEDQVICGNNTDMTAVLFMEGSEGYWTGPGFINDPNSEVANVSAPYGTHTYTWTEVNSICVSEQEVTISFIEQPNPTLVTQFDSTCTNYYEIQLENSNFNGQWIAYYGDPLEPLFPAPFYFPSFQSPVVDVTIGNFDETIRTVEFVWTETNHQSYGECTSVLSTNISFIKQPIASVGADNEAEVCGTLYSGLNADMTGSEWADGLWISPQASCDFNNASATNTVVSFNNLGIYGDSAFVRLPLLWTVSNYMCQDIDTMWLNMYQQPNANAGIDGAICGLDYDLQAFPDIDTSNNYTPSGWWSVFSGPGNQVVNIGNMSGFQTGITVSEVGIWEFLFRENNSLNTSCYDVDTVTVEFVEIPIVNAGEDQDICGKYAQLGADSGGNLGSWLVTPGVSFEEPTNPVTNISSVVTGAIEFTWIESNSATISTLSCTSKDEVIYTFYPQPTANILTDEDDNSACGYKFDNLRAETPGTGIIGYWYDENSSTIYGDVFSNDTWTQVPEYGCFDFYWIEESGPALNPGFCIDTAGPLNICFYEIPIADAGLDTLFCGLYGELNANPSVGIGVWSNPSGGIVAIDDLHNPESEISSIIYNTDLGQEESFTLIWMEDNNGCTDSEVVDVVFGRIPQSNITIIPPKCKGQQATIAAVDQAHLHYSWNFYEGQDESPILNDLGGNFQNFVSWENDNSEHIISLMVTSEWGCLSPIKIDTVREPSLPDFDYTVISDTCMFSKGGVLINDTTDITYFWLDENFGPPSGSPITQVLGVPEGTYELLSVCKKTHKLL